MRPELSQAYADIARLTERVRELEAALQEAMEWDWLTDQSAIPTQVLAQMNTALAKREG